MTSISRRLDKLLLLSDVALLVPAAIQCLDLVDGRQTRCRDEGILGLTSFQAEGKFLQITFDRAAGSLIFCMKDEWCDPWVNPPLGLGFRDNVGLGLVLGAAIDPDLDTVVLHVVLGIKADMYHLQKLMLHNLCFSLQCRCIGHRFD